MAAETATETIALAIPCPHCGDVARLNMTNEQARDHAAVILAAVDDVPPMRVPVAGGDQ